MKCKIYYLGGLETEDTNSLVIEFDKHLMLFNFGRGNNPVDVLGISRKTVDYSYIARKVEEGFNVVGLFLNSLREKYIGGVPYLIKELPWLKIFSTRVTSDALSRYIYSKTKFNIKDGALKIIKSGDKLQFVKNDKNKYVLSKKTKENNNMMFQKVEVVPFQTLSGAIDSCGYYVKIFDQAFCIIGETFFGAKHLESSSLDLDTLTTEAKNHPPILVTVDTSNTQISSFTAPNHYIGPTIQDEIPLDRKKKILFLLDIEEGYRFIEILRSCHHLKRSVFLKGTSLCKTYEYLKNIGDLKEFSDLRISFSTSFSNNHVPKEDVVIMSDTFDRVFKKVYSLMEDENNNFLKELDFEKAFVVITNSPIREVKMQNMSSQLSKFVRKTIHIGAKDKISPKGCLMDIILILNIVAKSGYIIGENTQEKSLHRLNEYLRKQENLVLLKEDNFYAMTFERNRLLKEKSKINADFKLLSSDGKSNNITTKILKNRITLGESGVLLLTMAIKKNGELMKQSIDFKSCAIFPTSTSSKSTIEEIRNNVISHNKNYIKALNKRPFNIEEYEAELKMAISKYINKHIKKRSFIKIMIGVQ